MLQKPNVSDKQINTLKQSLSDFISTVIKSESTDPSQAKRALISKIKTFMLNEAGYSKHELKAMDQKEMLHGFVHSYCNIQLHSLDRRGMLVEVLGTKSSLISTHTEESATDRWTRLAGL